LLGIDSESGAISIRSDGTLAGNGSIVGNVIVDGGTIEPGSSSGKLTVDGSVSMRTNARMLMEIGGTSDGMFDQLFASGDMTLGGNLIIDFINDFIPLITDEFLFLNGSTISGSFDNVEIRGLPTVMSYELFADGQQVVLRNVVPVPEPQTAFLFAIGTVLLGVTRQRFNLAACVLNRDFS